MIKFIFLFLALLIGFITYHRLRGDSFNLTSWMNKSIEAAIAGFFMLCIMIINGHVIGWHSIFVPLFYALGAAPGWSMIGEYIRGEKISPDPEWYQVGDLANNPTASIIVRSFIFSVPSLSLGYLSGDPHIISLGGALFLSFAGSVFVAKDWVKAEFTLPVFTALFYLIIQSGM